MIIEIDKSLNWIEVKDGIKVISKFDLGNFDEDEIKDCAKELGDLLNYLGHLFKIKEVGEVYENYE